MSQPSAPWADGPFPLIPTPAADLPMDHKMDPVLSASCEMTCVHNTIIRGINAIYLQAPHVKPVDESAFLNFTATMITYTHIHHTGEEKIFFPAIEEMTGVKGVMDANVTQHEGFQPGLEKLKEYVDSCLSGKEKYDGKQIVAFIDSFGQDLCQHLADEIPSLMDLRKYGDKVNDIQKKLGEDAQESMKQCGLTTGMVYCLLTHDVTYEGGRWANFPPAPWVILATVRNVMFYIHSDWWKFAPLDQAGRPKPLYAVPEKA